MQQQHKETTMVMATKKRDRVTVPDENLLVDEEVNEKELMEFDDEASDSSDSNNSGIVSAAATVKAQSVVKSYQTQFSPELLSQYYSRLFPFSLLCQWLSYDTGALAQSLQHQFDDNHSNPRPSKNSTVSSKLFSHREFSFTIEPVPGDEIYIRYQSFKSQSDFAAAVLKRQPRKIDIGAIFTHPPKDHHTIQSNNFNGNTATKKFQPQQRELVFDIDLTDYDEVRRCGCSQANICKICWKMMGMAVKVMDAGLREDFGFEHICWFYSGRRGVHCWVCDESARTLSDVGRSAVANYFEVNLGSDRNKNVQLYNPLHPSLQRAYDILEPMFIQNVLTPAPKGHNLLGNPSSDVNPSSSSSSWGHELLSALPPCASAVSESLSIKWKQDGNDTTPAEKWDELKRYLNVLIGKSTSSSSSPNTSSKKTKQAKNMSTYDISNVELWPIKQVFRYSYPRLDINVSKMQNHLLKSPFCVHPKTGRVCVPIDVKKIEDFDPFSVPTLPELMDELDAFNREETENTTATTDGENINGNTSEDKEGGSKKRKKKCVYDWEKTSLKESFTYFQKEFLIPMLKNLKKDEKVKSEKMAAFTGDF